MKTNKVRPTNILIVLGVVFSALVVLSFYPDINASFTKMSLKKMGVNMPANTIFIGLSKDNADEISIKNTQALLVH